MLVHEGETRSPAADRALALSLAGVAGALNTAGFYAVGLYASNMTGNVSAISDRTGTGDLVLAAQACLLVVLFVLGATTSTLMIRRRRRKARRRCSRSQHPPLRHAVGRRQARARPILLRRCAHHRRCAKAPPATVGATESNIGQPRMHRTGHRALGPAVAVRPAVEGVAPAPSRQHPRSTRHRAATDVQHPAHRTRRRRLAFPLMQPTAARVRRHRRRPSANKTRAARQDGLSSDEPSRPYLWSLWRMNCQPRRHHVCRALHHWVCRSATVEVRRTKAHSCCS